MCMPCRAVLSRECGQYENKSVRGEHPSISLVIKESYIWRGLPEVVGGMALSNELATAVGCGPDVTAFKSWPTMPFLKCTVCCHSSAPRLLFTHSHGDAEWRTAFFLVWSILFQICRPYKVSFNVHSSKLTAHLVIE